MSKSPKRIVGVGSRLDAFQAGCDLVGMTEIPFVSQGADIISGAVSLATGDLVGAGLSVAGLVPGLGQVSGPAKMARRAKKIADAADTAKKTAKTAQQQEKFLDLTLKGKKANTTPPPPKAKQHAEVDAKPAKKENVKEKKDVDKREASQSEQEKGSKLDVSDGPTNAIKNKGFNNKVDAQVQSVNYNSFVKQVENGKPFYNPTSVMPKGNMKI